MMKTMMKRMIVVFACAAMILASPAISLAASTASNVTELAKEVAKHGMKREKKFSVKYTGPESELDSVIYDEDATFFYNTLSVVDDPTTTDDADYLVGNLKMYDQGFNYYAVGNEMFFEMLYVETLDQTKYVDSQVPLILDELGVASMSNYDKVKTIHDYVCNLITYKNSEDDIVSTMYGALTTGKALCNSYSLCMYKLLVSAGVPCKYVSGQAGTGRDADGHAWNIVALGDKWYYLDATWDDQDTIEYNYFLKGSSDFDECDPSEAHKLEAALKKDPFKSAFPIATSKFNPTMMSDVNNVVKIGDSAYSGGGDAGGDEGGDYEGEELAYEDVIEGTYPVSGKFTVKKNKRKELQVWVQKPARSSVVDAIYTFTTGKGCVKKIKDYGYDEKYGFTSLVFTGKKKGKVTVDITLILSSGQEMTVTFTGKVK